MIINSDDFYFFQNKLKKKVYYLLPNWAIYIDENGV